MNDEKLDLFLRAYQSETDLAPSRKLMDDILAVPDQSRSFVFRPWHWFDMMMPKAVGWALTCCLGIYIGLLSPDGGVTADEEYYLYGQAQILLSEDMTQEDTD